MNGSLADRLKGKQRVHLDTMAVIYFIERHPTYLPLVRSVFRLMEEGDLLGISSYVTLIEVLIQPLRKGRPDLASQYRDTLTGSRNFRLFPVDKKVAEESAEIRAQHNLTVPDAIQLATAYCHGADAYVTNEINHKRYSRIEVLVLDDYLSGPEA